MRSGTRFSRSLYRFRRRRRLGSPASCAAPTEAPVARTALQCLDDRLSSQPVRARYTDFDARARAVPPTCPAAALGAARIPSRLALGCIKAVFFCDQGVFSALFEIFMNRSTTVQISMIFRGLFFFLSQHSKFYAILIYFMQF